VLLPLQHRSQCLLPIHGPAVGTVQFIHLSQTSSVAAAPVVPVVVTRARSRAVSAVRSVHRPVAGNQCPTGGTVQFLHRSQTFSADTAPVRYSNSSTMLQCLLPQPLSRLKLSRWKGSVHRSIADRQWTSSSATRSPPQISIAATAQASVDSRRLPVLLKLQHLLQCLLSSTTALASAEMLAVDTRVTVQAYLLVQVQCGSFSSAAAVRTYVAEPTVATKVEAQASSCLCSWSSSVPRSIAMLLLL